MTNVAIIAFFHLEASLCLAKYMAKQGLNVDFYAITDTIRDKGFVSGMEYFKAKKVQGIYKLREIDIPEIYEDTKNLPIAHFLIRIPSYSQKLWWLDKIILKRALNKIKKQKYYAINIVGQQPWVEYIHDQLRTEKICHTFHEIGSHANGDFLTPLMGKVIKDRSKVILPSHATYSRFISLPGAEHCEAAYIPVGKHETMLLYERDCELSIPLDLSKPTFLFYGFIRTYKGLDLLKEAHSLLSKEYDKFNLIIAGGGSDPTLSYFEKQKNCFVINRFMTDEELMKLNRICSVVVLPYKSASQSGIILTSFMFGNPIIATNVGALAETIKDEYNGLIVEPNNPVAFSKAMNRMIEDKRLFDELHENAKKFGCGDENDWNVIAKQTKDFLLEKEQNRQHE